MCGVTSKTRRLCINKIEDIPPEPTCNVHTINSGIGGSNGKQLKPNEEFDSVVEEDLKPQKLDRELSKEDLIGLCNDKDTELNITELFLIILKQRIKIFLTHNKDMT